MKCPICTNVSLAMAERQGVEIDYCPQCRGVWLDRGELDKIIELSVTTPSRSSNGASTPERRDHDDRDHDEGFAGKRKRRGMFGELFDF